jgi:hypothetical protein
MGRALSGEEPFFSGTLALTPVAPPDDRITRAVGGAAPALDEAGSEVV